jgi:hypothetical protein
VLKWCSCYASSSALVILLVIVVVDIMLSNTCSPRSIGDFFTWGPVVTEDAAYMRELRLFFPELRQARDQDEQQRRARKVQQEEQKEQDAMEAFSAVRTAKEKKNSNTRKHVKINVEGVAVDAVDGAVSTKEVQSSDTTKDESLLQEGPLQQVIRAGRLSGVSVRQPILAAQRLNRVRMPVLLGTRELRALPAFFIICCWFLAVFDTVSVL